MKRNQSVLLNGLYRDLAFFQCHHLWFLRMCGVIKGQQPYAGYANDSERFGTTALNKQSV